MQVDHPEIILASASAARAEILGGAGVRFHQLATTIDEGTEILKLGPGAAPSDIAAHLARCKAQAAAEHEPSAVIVSADQILALDGEILQKPADIAEARAQLLRLRGHTHYLHSAALVLYNGQMQSTVDIASLTMRNFSDDFLEWYLETANESMLTAVGAYHFEGVGIHLFESFKGDYFTILGLPIMPVLHELRRLNVLET